MPKTTPRIPTEGNINGTDQKSRRYDTEVPTVRRTTLSAVKDARPIGRVRRSYVAFAFFVFCDG
jgi:hypothetical protein